MNSINTTDEALELEADRLLEEAGALYSRTENPTGDCYTEAQLDRHARARDSQEICMSQLSEAQRHMVEAQAGRPDDYSDLVVEQAMSELTEHQEAVVTLLTEGYTQSEIAEILGCSRSTVQTHLSRARKKLAWLIEEA